MRTYAAYGDARYRCGNWKVIGKLFGVTPVIITLE